jgi:hypothetical protein
MQARAFHHDKSGFAATVLDRSCWDAPVRVAASSGNVALSEDDMLVEVERVESVPSDEQAIEADS